MGLCLKMFVTYKIGTGCVNGLDGHMDVRVFLRSAYSNQVLKYFFHFLRCKTVIVDFKNADHILGTCSCRQQETVLKIILRPLLPFPSLTLHKNLF